MRVRDMRRVGRVRRAIMRYRKTGWGKERMGVGACVVYVKAEVEVHLHWEAFQKHSRRGRFVESHEMVYNRPYYPVDAPVMLSFPYRGIIHILCSQRFRYLMPMPFLMLLN